MIGETEIIDPSRPGKGDVKKITHSDNTVEY
jgi:hypothetical protein